MGGRGASSGVSVKGKPYGSEYTTLLQSGNIKFVRYNDSTSAKTPMETMTRGRVYVTVNSEDNLVAITYYDNANKRRKQIDLTHEHEGKKPHTHEGLWHDENGTHRLTPEEKAMVERVQKLWYNRHSK
ncbi:MAG: hypothetical protein LUG47_05380 [Clostridiales bacterium]|nr:hypothetical protein [Clostridiales bacterium]